jgi:hypothetical protein
MSKTHICGSYIFPLLFHLSLQSSHVGWSSSSILSEVVLEFCFGMFKDARLFLLSNNQLES